MAKKFEGFNWTNEIKELGIKQALIKRAKFHNGLDLHTVMKCTGRSKSTCQKHLRKLEAEGHIRKEDIVAVSSDGNEFYHYNHKRK